MEKVLIVDDAELNRELLCDILKGDYAVETASDGEEALGKLKKYEKETAAILLDLRMPKIDGFTVIAKMRQNGWLKHIPVLIISSEHAVEIEAHCFELGVSDKECDRIICLQKPTGTNRRRTGADSEKTIPDHPDTGGEITGGKAF